ncbi:MAG TPA: hypothetical protein VG389_27945 [Myxococcota bacterium]|jgi:hypothetical protein|nr:hypothetical protein [Myxococcota bacterium]
MKRTLPFSRSEPRIVRIPSPEARSSEAALERAIEDPARRFDLWVHLFPTVDAALALRARLAEHRVTQHIALVAVVEEIDRLPGARAVVAAERGRDGGLAAVLPASAGREALDQASLVLIERQRAAGRHGKVRDLHLAAEAEEERLRALEHSLARRMYGALTALTGTGTEGLVGPLDKSMEAFERLCVSRALAEFEGDVATARRVLKVSRSRFYRLLETHALRHLVERDEPGNGDDEE